VGGNDEWQMTNDKSKGKGQKAKGKNEKGQWAMIDKRKANLTWHRALSDK
jgi:hypothetical protein